MKTLLGGFRADVNHIVCHLQGQQAIYGELANLPAVPGSIET